MSKTRTFNDTLPQRYKKIGLFNNQKNDRETKRKLSTSRRNLRHQDLSNSPHYEEHNFPIFTEGNLIRNYLIIAKTLENISPGNNTNKKLALCYTAIYMFSLFISGSYADTVRQPSHVNNDAIDNHELTQAALLENMSAEEPLQEGPAYKGHPTKILHKKDLRCKKKTGINEGKVCTIKNTTIFLKKVAENAQQEKISKDTNKVQRSNPFRPMYFLEFVKNISNKILRPQLFFYYEVSDNSQKPELYSGSNLIKQFIAAETLVDKTRELFGDRADLTTRTYLYQALVQAISRKNVPILFITSFFIGNLANSWDNWGFDKKQNLIIIDADYPALRLVNFINNAKESLDSFSHYGIYLSIDDIKDMQKVLEKMKSKKLPNIHESVNLTQDSYNLLLDIFIDACKATTQKLEYITGPSKAINTELKEFILDYGSVYIDVMDTDVTQYRHRA